jgi:hypothetical protein
MKRCNGRALHAVRAAALCRWHGKTVERWGAVIRHGLTLPPRKPPTLYVHRAPAAAKDLKIARLRVSFDVTSNGG